MQKILIVEDDPQSLKLLSAILKEEKYEVFTAMDGYEAVKVAQDKRPDLIILDVKLPCGDGFTVHERLNNNPNFLLVPVIYVTANASASVHESAMKMGAFAVLAKPLDRSQMLRAVLDALEGHEAVSQGSDPLIADATCPENATVNPKSDIRG